MMEKGQRRLSTFESDHELTKGNYWQIKLV